MANYSRKMLEQIPDQFELGTLLTPTISNLIQNYAPPKTRTINGKSLENDIWLTAADVGARSNTWLPTPEEIDAYRRINGVEDNFVWFGAGNTLKDSGKNNASYLPAKYLPSDNDKVLKVDSTGTVNAVAQSSLFQYMFVYNTGKSYEVGESFYYGTGSELGIYTTITPHGPEAFTASRNQQLAKVGLASSYMDFNLSTPVSNAVFTLTGTLQQLMQGALNNIKNLQDRVLWLENNAVTTDNNSNTAATGLALGKVKLNLGTVVTTPQTGYYVIRVDPNDVLP